MEVLKLEPNKGNDSHLEDEDEYEYERKIDIILEWATRNPNFDCTFVEKMQQKVISGVWLTPNQESAIDNILAKFRIRH